MGNAQSAALCSNGPICRALCLRTGAPADDDGEWFGDLPREKKRQKIRKSKSQRSVAKLPILPEESDTVESTIDEVGSSSGSPGNVADDVESTTSASETTSLASSTSDCKTPPRRSRRSSLHDATSTMKDMKPRREPKANLTFVNGQFVDMSTREGEDLVKKFSSGEGSGVVIGGIAATVRSGHCGIIPPSASSASVRSSKSEKNVRRFSSFGNQRSKSDGSAISSSLSASSGRSFTSQDITASQDTPENGLNSYHAVSSVVVLGGGYILTASRFDRVVKMWRVENNNGETKVEFIRDFVGHNVGVTCLAKVDGKGRFLSASKDRRIKLWDSRFNCDDNAEGANAHRILLATFDDMDRRKIHDIAITEEGSYVRPTDKVDMAMAAAMTKKAMAEGSSSVTKAARERQIIACSCEFATISGRHKVVKIWSVKHVENQDHLPPEGNVAEVKSEQDLKHDAVVESIAADRGKGLILSGDRMGNVMLWQSVKNVFLPGTARVWSCIRTFSWKPKSELSKCEESMQFAITSLSLLQGNALFVSGSRSGNLRVWKADGTKATGETIRKEVICITGAHSQAITAVQQGPQVEDGELTVSFSSASEDGKVLSFAVPAGKIGSSNPCCFNVVNHGIANRYFPDADPIAVTALACLNMPNNSQDILITGCTNGDINVLKAPITSKLGRHQDALVLYRQRIEEESLTLYAIADKIREGGIESRSRKLHMKNYKNCFLGTDVVSYLVDNGYAASRADAVDLGCVLASHVSLFECVSKRGKSLEDDVKSYYRWSSKPKEYLDCKAPPGDDPEESAPVEISKREKLKKFKSLTSSNSSAE